MALLDRATIEALYAASSAGVQIDLIVRGICALRPGGARDSASTSACAPSSAASFSASRIFTFANGGKPEVFCGSADWMPRNLFERCEVTFPVTDPALSARIRDEILGSYLRDNVKARLLQPDGTYIRALKDGRALPGAQDYLMEIALAERKDPQ